MLCPQIGRGAWRGRGEVWGGAASGKKKKKQKKKKVRGDTLTMVTIVKLRDVRERLCWGKGDRGGGGWKRQKEMRSRNPYRPFPTIPFLFRKYTTYTKQSLYTPRTHGFFSDGKTDGNEESEPVSPFSNRPILVPQIHNVHKNNHDIPSEHTLFFSYLIYRQTQYR